MEVIPDRGNDTEFYLLNLGSVDGVEGCSGYTAFFSVCAYEAATSVSVLAKSGGTLVEVVSVVLNEYESYTNRTLTSGDVEENFSGYVIRTSSSASVYTGNRCYAYNSVSYSTWSSIPSVSNLGLTHVTFDLDTAADQYVVKVVAVEDNTEVQSSAGDSVTLDSADVAEFVYTGSDISMVNCSKKCAVMQMVNGSSDTSGISQHSILPTNG